MKKWEVEEEEDGEVVTKKPSGFETWDQTTKRERKKREGLEAMVWKM